MRVLGRLLLAFPLLLLLSESAQAQSSIAGEITDDIGGVLPGVTVEASSPALIEGSRLVVSDGAGKYSIIDLRPGVYDVRFVLPGFSTVVREAVEVLAGVSVPINARMAVGALQETITVSGATPVVDIQQATQHSVIDRETIQALPTNRTTHTVGMVLPGLKMTGSMLGGAGTTVLQRYMTTRGKNQAQNSSQVDGMDTDMITGGGHLPYDNIGMAQEVSIETNPVSAETGGSGIRINMIPRDGGNAFSGDMYFSGMDGAWQANNITDALRARAATTPDSTEHMFDLNPAFGGPLARDRLWFYLSGRVNRAKLAPAGASYFSPDPETGQLLPDPSRPGFNNTATDNVSFRLTWQANRKHKLASYRDQFWRYQSHYHGTATTDWATAPVEYARGTQYIWPTKWTYAATSRLLIESGFQYWKYDNRHYNPQPGTLFEEPAGYGGPPETQTGPWYANAGQYHLPGGYVTKAHNFAYCCRRGLFPAFVLLGSASYVTGSHSIKAGITGRTGVGQNTRQQHNGSLLQWYLDGEPFRVRISPNPSDIRVEVNRDVGVYVQDRWTIDRLTISAGVRVEHFKGGVGASSSPAGRFVPARHSREYEVFNFTDVLPRFGVVYDLLGNARTALKFSAGRYVAKLGTLDLEPYSTMRIAHEDRGWFDRDLGGLDLPTNGDDIAQDNEIVRSSDPQFGIRAAQRADPALQREDSWDFSAGVQHELAPGMSLTAMWYHVREGSLWALRDMGVSPDDYRRFDIANPLHPSERIPVYDLLPGTEVGDIVTVSSAVNQRTYNGVELSTQARLATGGTVVAGWFVDRQLVIDCDTHDPNNFRFCDETGGLYADHGVVEPIPFRNEFKLALTHGLPGGLEAAFSFISYPGVQNVPLPGQTLGVTDLRWRDAVLPISDTPWGQPTVPIRGALLLAPGQSYLERWNQLDISFKWRFRLGEVSVLPTLDIYDVNNSSVVMDEVENYGSSLGRPLSILGGRLMRLGVLMRF